MDELPHPPDPVTDADLAAWEALARKAPPEVVDGARDLLRDVEAAVRALEAMDDDDPLPPGELPPATSWAKGDWEPMDSLLEKASEDVPVPHPSEPPPFDWGPLPEIARRPPGQARSIMILVDLYDPIGRAAIGAYSRALFQAGRTSSAIELQNHLEATAEAYRQEHLERGIPVATEGPWEYYAPGSRAATVTPPEEDETHE